MTWYISQMDAEQAEAMGKAFTAANPSIREAVVRVTGQVATVRSVRRHQMRPDSFPETSVCRQVLLMHLACLSNLSLESLTGDAGER